MKISGWQIIRMIFVQSCNSRMTLKIRCWGGSVKCVNSGWMKEFRRNTAAVFRYLSTLPLMRMIRGGSTTLDCCLVQFVSGGKLHLAWMTQDM